MKEDRDNNPCDDTAKVPTMDHRDECSRLYEELANKEIIIKALIELVKGRE